ncbi:MAG TPA: NADP-dependent oxidoreductase, partial [Chitinophaga sp.]
NPVDVKTRMGRGVAGRLKDIRPLILGWDISGVVEAVSPDVTQFKPGDAVFGMVNFPGLGSAYAEYVAAPAAHLALKPDNISFEAAAVTTLAPLTAYQVLHTHYHLPANQRVLIHAAAGGVGHFAIQMAKLAGAYVVGTTSAHNHDFVRSLGADEVIDYKTQRLEDATSNIDFVLDTIGGDTFNRSLKVMKPGSTIVSIAGPLPEEAAEKAKALGIHASFQQVVSNGKDMQALADLLAQGKLQPCISATFAFEDMGKAHLQIESGHTIGKVVVKLERPF